MTTLEIITPILENTYGEGETVTALAEYLSGRIDTFEPSYPDDTRERMICVTCWDWMTGGSTAASVARRIEAAL